MSMPVVYLDGDRVGKGVSLELVDEAHDLVLLQRRVLFRELDRLHRESCWSSLDYKMERMLRGCCMC
jgi:hypothetical protein